MTRRLPVINCPPSTQNISLNLKNRQIAIQSAKYGPANPRLANEQYWRDIASVWGIRPADAKTMRCGNCAAFDVSPEILNCIREGLEGGLPADEVMLAAELGYCHAFRFKCAASRTCTAWIVGGPITKYKGAR